MSSPTKYNVHKLLKLDTTIDQGLEKSLKSLATYLQSQIKASDGLPKIAKNILDDLPTAQNEHSFEAKITINVKAYFDSVCEALKDVLVEQFTNGVSNTHAAEVKSPEVEYDKQTGEITAKLQVDTANASRYNKYKDAAMKLKTSLLNVEHRLNVLDNPSGVANEFNSQIKCTRRACVKATEEERIGGEARLASSLELILNQPELDVVHKEIKILKMHNDWEGDQGGTQILKILKENYGTNKTLVVNQINLRHLCGYLKKFPKKGIRYSIPEDSTNPNYMWKFYVDADWAGDLQTRKSTTGYIISFMGGPIITKSTRQKLTALSSTEAEYVSFTSILKDIKWITKLAKCLRIPFPKPAYIRNDNLTAQGLAQGTAKLKATKHIDTRYHFIKEAVKLGIVELVHVPRNENISDMLTHPLGPTEHKRQREQLLNERSLVIQSDPMLYKALSVIQCNSVINKLTRIDHQLLNVVTDVNSLDQVRYRTLTCS
eukprot:g3674.t1